MEAKAKPKTVCKRKALACPNCESDGDSIGYVEMIPATFSIHGVTANGTIIIDAESEETHHDCAESAKLACQNCGHEWPFTREIDWMDHSDWEDFKNANL